MLRRVSLPKAWAVTWTVLIFITCWVPGRHLPDLRGDEVGWFPIFRPDKVMHALLFGVFGALWMFAGRPGVGRVVSILLAGVVLAAVTEAVQGLPAIRRVPGVADALADVIGLLIGVGLALAYQAATRARGASRDQFAVAAPRSSMD